MAIGCGHNLAHRCMEQGGHGRQRRQEHPLVPQRLLDVFAVRMVKGRTRAQVGEGTGDVRLPRGARTHGEHVQITQAFDRSGWADHGRDVRHAPQHTLATKALIQHLHVVQAVEQWQDKPTCGSARHADQGIVQVIGFGRKHDQVVVRLECVGTDGGHGQRESLAGRLDRQALTVNRLLALLSQQKRDVRAGTDQLRAEIATDATGTDHQNFHVQSLLARSACILGEIAMARRLSRHRCTALAFATHTRPPICGHQAVLDRNSWRSRNKPLATTSKAPVTTMRSGI